MSGFARFILVNYKQDLLGKNTVDNIGTFVLKGNALVIIDDDSECGVQGCSLNSSLSRSDCRLLWWLRSCRMELVDEVATNTY